MATQSTTQNGFAHSGNLIVEPTLARKKRMSSSQKADTAHYIAHMAGELARLATDANLETISYLLSMAHLEADVEARR